MNTFKVKKGFTLIELLVVIGVLAVISAGVVALINPQDKLLQGNDASIQNAIGQFATGLQSYAAQHNGLYPTVGAPDNGLTALITTGELVTMPTQPTGYAAWTYTGGGASARVCGQLRSRKYTQLAAPRLGWAWCSSTGRIGPVDNCTPSAMCP